MSIRYFTNRALAIVSGIGLTWLAAAAPASAAECKGLAQGKCEAAGECSWVNSYTTKAGAKVDGYCRRKPSGTKESSKSNTGADRKPAANPPEAAKQSADSASTKKSDAVKSGEKKSSEDKKKTSTKPVPQSKKDKSATSTTSSSKKTDAKK